MKNNKIITKVMMITTLTNGDNIQIRGIPARWAVL